MEPSTDQPTAGPNSQEPPSRRSRRWLHLPGRWERRALFVAVYLLFCGSLVWGTVRIYWYFSAAVPLGEAPTVWDFYYPRIRGSGLVSQHVTRDDARFDLLLLGGSVLEPDWGSIQLELQARLDALIPGRASIYNLSRSAFTSRDSLLQYQHLQGQRFDLVLVYDGINDVRMNYCRPELFRDDYAHCHWYSSFARRLKAGSISLPAATLDRLATVAEFIPLGTPDPQQLEFGGNPQTPRTVRANLAAIIRLAAERGDPVLLQTYAWHIPADYSQERLQAGTLDYASERPVQCAVELWGRPEHVIRTLELQNTAIRELAAEHPEVGFVDQHDLLPKSGEYFIDPCHLSAAGCRRFVDNIWPEIERAVRASPAWHDTRRAVAD